MKYRKIANSDLELSVITFGAWAAGGWMWGGTEHNDSIHAIQSAYDLGMTSIDTAPIYGQGYSEEIVGKAIKDLPRDKVQILTKYGMRWDSNQGEFYFHSKNNQGQDIDIYKLASKESIIKECEDSLRRLKTDYIDLYQIHWPDTTTPIEESMEAVNQLIKDGKVRYAGVCNYNAQLLDEARKYSNVISDQVPFSMVKRDIESDVVPYVVDHQLSILAYSPLERGLLTGKITEDYTFNDGDHRAGNPYFSAESIKETNVMLNKIKPIAQDKGITLAQLVLKWTIEQAGITVALAGARTPEQSTQNAKAAEVNLSTEELTYMNKAVNEWQKKW